MIKFIVITGGPGAGKTAVLEIVKKQICQHVAVLPEAASVIFGGGFWRLSSSSAKKASQRAIYYVQNEMERLVREEKKWTLAICDRGTLDGLAYWPDTEQDFWNQLKINKDDEYAKYSKVIHLRTPSSEMGYNWANPLRIETAVEANLIDQKIEEIWHSHPGYVQISSQKLFLDKAQDAVRLIMEEAPDCCLGTPKAR